MHRPNRTPDRFVGTLLLLLALLLAGVVQAEYLGGITFDKTSPSFLPNGVHVDVSIDYKIDVAEGRRVYVVPYTDGAPSPGYGVSGSVVYPQGTGTASAYFTILSGDVVVDHVRVYSRDPDFTETPLELFVPVYYEFGAHGIYNIQPNHSQYSRLPWDEDLIIDFDYGVDAPGCKIYARPWNGSHLEPGYSASGSADLPPSGSYSQNFSFDGDADISHIRFRIFALDNQTLLDEFFVPWDCHWREWGVYDIEFNHGQLTSLHNSQNLESFFVLEHSDPNGLYVWTWSIQDGGYCPGSVYQPSSNLPMGATATSRYTRVNSGTQQVDAIRFLVGSAEEYYMTFDVPLLLEYGPHAVQNFEFEPASPAIMSYGQRLDMIWDYYTDEGAGVRQFARAAFEETPLMGMTSSGSPLYPAPSGVADFWMYYGADREANSIRIQMVSGDQSEQFLEWFEPCQFLWAGSGTITDAVELPVAATLERIYPNPFNPTTTIPVVLPQATEVRLAIYDVRGRLARVLHDGILPAGRHPITLDGHGLSSGAYICRLETPSGVSTQRLTLVR
jgi:hypothetical protein